MKMFLSRFIVFCALAFGSLSANAAYLDGTTLTYQHHFDGTSFQYPIITSVVGPGIEFSPSYGWYVIDVSDTSLKLTMMADLQWNISYPFNGAVIEDLTDNAPSFLLTGVSVNGASVVNDFVSITDDAIRINIAGYKEYWFIGETITLSLFTEPAAVPEPESAGLVALALAALAFTRRRKVK